MMISFSVAVSVYRLIQRGMDLSTALIVANARQGRKELSSVRKATGAARWTSSRKRSSLEVLLNRLEGAALKEQSLLMTRFPFLTSEERSVLSLLVDSQQASGQDALGHVVVSRVFFGEEILDKDLCYSNTDGAEVFFR